MRRRPTKPDEYRTPPDLMVASALMSVNQLPTSKRPYALRALAEHHRLMHAELNEPLPEWVRMLPTWPTGTAAPDRTPVYRAASQSINSRTARLG
jgi:hypothetical protein